jgi:hypothetical protein
LKSSDYYFIYNIPGEQLKVLYVFGFPTDFAATWVFNKIDYAKSKKSRRIGFNPNRQNHPRSPTNKICTCGACEPRKSKLPSGMRRLKVYYKAGCTETICVILLHGEWIRRLGFNVEDHVIVSEKKGQLIINLEAE